MHPRGAAVGIDLGTSNTVVAHADGGVARALVDAATGDAMIPSVAAFLPNGNVLVGAPAKARRLQDPKNTIFSAKRLIGRAWTSREVGQARVRLPYELREGKNASVMVRARGREYTLPEISAFVLRKAKAVAEAELGTRVERAVITCPANFDELQRAATKLAGQLAGLRVLRVLSEPTAAALAYGYGKEGQERILVYDFGGGTFDVTVLEREGDTFRVRATAGDMYLGGDDVDAVIAVRIAEAFAAKHGYDPRGDKQVFEHVRGAAERVKVRLASEERAVVPIEEVTFGTGGKSLRLDFAMDRRELAAIVDPLVDRAEKVVKRAMAQAGYAMSGIDQVILVGGTTLIPRVRERVAALAGREPAHGVAPFEAIAVGAAIQAYAMADVPDEDVPLLDPSGVTEASVMVSRSIVTLPPPPPSASVGAPSGRAGNARASRGNADAARVSRAAPPSWKRWAVGALAVMLVALGLAVALR
jgi:molecular chaperone DnaK